MNRKMRIYAKHEPQPDNLEDTPHRAKRTVPAKIRCLNSIIHNVEHANVINREIISAHCR